MLASISSALFHLTTHTHSRHPRWNDISPRSSQLYLYRRCFSILLMMIIIQIKTIIHCIVFIAERKSLSKQAAG